jgi:hypothetical protein
MGSRDETRYRFFEENGYKKYLSVMFDRPADLDPFFIGLFVDGK